MLGELFDEEIRSHLELSAREQMLNGADPEAAQRAALEEFGDVEAVRESLQRVWFGSRYGTVMRVWRRLVRCGRVETSGHDDVFTGAVSCDTASARHAELARHP